MKHSLWGAVALPAAMFALSGCVYDDYSYGGWSGSYGAVGVGYSSGYQGYYDRDYYRPYGYGPVYYDAFYDNFYGPVYGGYWHNDGLFYYQTYFGGPWYGDYSRHFRRESFRGGNHYRFEDRREAQIVNQAVDRIIPGRGNGQYNGGQAGMVSGLQGNPGPAPQQGGGRRSGPMATVNGLVGGPGGASGNAPSPPAGAAPSPGPGGMVGRAQDAFRGNRGGDDGGVVSRSPSSERSAPAPRSSPPPAPRSSAMDTVRNRVLGGNRD